MENNCRTRANGVRFGDIVAVDDQTAKEKTALTAAQAWLKLIDTEKYDASWQGTAEFFRQKVTREQWIQMMDTGRKGLGVPKTRTKVSSWFRHRCPALLTASTSPSVRVNLFK